MENHDYVLGVTGEEYDRLALQHDLWKTRSIRLWQRAGLPANAQRSVKAIDLGCGPGFTTLELARYLGPRGKVVGVDMAEKYLAALETRAKARKGNTNAKIETKNAPIDSFSLGEKDFDIAYARWIFIFLTDPEAAIRNVGKHLKKGGHFVLQEYLDYGAMALYPEDPAIFRKVITAVIASWKKRGSDADIAQRLPSLLSRNGFEIVSLTPQARVGRPHQKIWQWPNSFFKNFLPVLESEGFLSAKEVAEFRAVWESAGNNPEAFFQGPTVLDIVARKR